MSAVSEIEITAMYDFWSTTNGPHWTWRNESNTTDEMIFASGVPWNFSSPLTSSQPCSDHWQGVNCSAGGDHVTGLILNSYGLDGVFPSSICDMYALQFIAFAANQLHGDVPSCISKLTNLGVLDIQDNSISGPIPETLWEMTQLDWLNFYSNQITGTLSPGVGNLTKLRLLSLSVNLLSGELPIEMGELFDIIYAPIGMDYSRQCTIVE